MLKDRFLLLLFCLLGVITLQAQTFSRIELLNSLPLIHDYDYVTTWSDSLLHFYKIENTANTFVLKHWTCSTDGVLTTPIGIYAYSSVESWGTTFPTYRTYWKQYGYLYISFTVLDYFHLIKISPVGQVTHDIIADNTDTGFHLFTPDYLYFTRYYGYPTPLAVFRHNLNTDTADSLFTWSEYTSLVFNNLADKYLLIAPQQSDNLNNCVLIDTLQVAHPCCISGIPFIYKIETESPEILPDTYFAGVENGLLRDYSFGILTFDNYNLVFEGIGGYINMGGYYYGSMFSDIIPYGNGRISCIEGIYEFNISNFASYIYDGTELNYDNNFPNLSAYANAFSLQRVNDRYAVAIAGPQTGPRNFICIDYQNQSVTDSVFTFTNAPNIDYADLYSDNDNLFYLYQTVQGMYLYILKIVEYTANADPVQIQQVMLCSAYPNPFFNQTSIKVSLKQPEAVTASIYNLKGQLVRTLSSQGKAELTQELVWDGKTDNGKVTAPGIYIYKTSTLSGQSITGKIIHLQ
jgi:hypothetical protein